MNKFIDFSNLTDEPVQTDGPYYYDSTNLLTVNVYDTIANKTVDIFDNIPSDYYTGVWNNNTRGNIVVTAYRTLASDRWGYKWYRYDARGRVIKMWHQIDGSGTKITEYVYNSSNQMIYTSYQTGQSDYKLVRNMLDPAGRLSAVDYWNQPTLPDTNDADNPSNWTNFTSYTYNQNSQILRQSFNGFGNQLIWDYSYNLRNWISAYEEDPSDDPCNPDGIFKYNLSYEPNGNISNQVLNGSYKDNFTVTNYLSFQFTYDLSNRLRIVDELNIGGKANHLENTYDKDGNILTLKRFNSSGNLTDDFSYSYYTGQGGIKTNKLRKVSGSSDQFTYDGNCNMITDALNSNTNIQYDHRNLITQIQKLNTTIEPIQNQLTIIRRMLSEAKSRLVGNAGNRIRKVIFENTDPEAVPIINIDNPSGGWVMLSEEYYSRGADGLELAIYRNSGSGAELKQHNIFAGSDNSGKLRPETGHQYYIKDHLGSVRVIIDPDRSVLSANDYDAWGYYLDGRGYEQTPNFETPNYKFTSKERDRESNYDYFGARYYDSRIGRWGSVDPLFEKHLNFSPFNYVLDNPLYYIDPDGRQLKFSSDESERNHALGMLKLSLPPEYRENVDITTNENSEYILDVAKLQNSFNIGENEFVNKLYTIASSSQSTEIIFLNENEQFYAFDNEKGKLEASYLGIHSKTNNNNEIEKYLLSGYTVYSGQAENNEKPRYTSKGGSNIAYVLRSASFRQRVIHLSHELYIHVYRYISGMQYTHESEEVNNEVNRIEKQADENFNSK